MLDASQVLIGGGISAAVALLVFLLLDVPMAASPERGARGFARAKARDSGFFGPFEAPLRMLATHVSKLPLARRRQQVDDALLEAGEFRGLTPDEFIVISVLTGLCGLLAAGFFFRTTDSVILPLTCLLLGPSLPSLQLRGQTKARFKAVERGLPAAIDLASLCMSAGLDFPGAMKHVVKNMPEDENSPVKEELQRILQELSLGRTRRQALEGLAKRVKTDAVQEFVASVVQAEEKGTPISVVLGIQASALRGRRSVLAEEAAAKAGVLLMLPMVMIMGAIVLLLMGPLFIQMSQGAM